MVLQECKIWAGVYMKQIVNLDTAKMLKRGNGGRFEVEFASLTQTLGAEKLGVSLAILAPGKRAFPRHAHHANEEMMFILEGTGTYHYGNDSAPVRAGDLIAAPAGDASTAHQIENTSGKPMKYLTFSTMIAPEVVEYPDSGKFLVSSGSGPDRFRFIGRAGTSLDYFDGEDG